MVMVPLRLVLARDHGTNGLVWSACMSAHPTPVSFASTQLASARQCAQHIAAQAPSVSCFSAKHVNFGVTNRPVCCSYSFIVTCPQCTDATAPPIRLVLSLKSHCVEGGSTPPSGPALPSGVVSRAQRYQGGTNFCATGCP